MKYFAAISSGALVGLAGCGGGDGDSGGDGTTTTSDDGGNGGDGDGGDDGGSGELVDPIHTQDMQSNPTEIQFNDYNPNRSAHGEEPLQENLWGPLVNRNDHSGEYFGDVCDEWNLDNENQEFTLHIRDDLEWWDGTPVAAQDIAAQWRLDRFMQGENAGVWRFLDSIETDGESKDFTATLKSPVNESVFMETVLHGTTLGVKYDLYKQHIDEFEAASSEEATETAQSNLLERTIDEPYGFGMWEIDTINNQRMAGTLRESGHYALDLVEYDYEWLPSQSEQNPQLKKSMILDDKLDCSWGINLTSEDYQNQIPGDPVFPKLPTYNGFGLLFQHDTEPFDTAEARKAVAHAADLTRTWQLTLGPVSAKDTHYSGLSRLVIHQYVPEDLTANFTDYTEPNYERAEELLSEAGLSKEGGNWMLESGEPFSIDIQTPGARVEWAQIITSNLSDIGVDAEVQTVEAGKFFGQTIPNQNFTVALWGWGGPYLKPNPYDCYNSTYQDFLWAEGMNAPTEQEVPMPVGDPEGSTETVNVDELIDELITADEETFRENVQTLAWTFNQNMPQLPVFENNIRPLLTRDAWNVPDSMEGSHLGVLSPVHTLPKVGELTAKRK